MAKRVVCVDRKSSGYPMISQSGEDLEDKLLQILFRMMIRRRIENCTEKPACCKKVPCGFTMASCLSSVYDVGAFSGNWPIQDTGQTCRKRSKRDCFSSVRPSGTSPSENNSRGCSVAARLVANEASLRFSSF